MATMRPIDEIKPDAKLTIHQNAAITWLRDQEGIDYQLPGWLVKVLNLAEERGGDLARAEIREALGLLPDGAPFTRIVHELGGIHDALEHGDTVIIDPGSVKATRIRDAMNAPDAVARHCTSTGATPSQVSPTEVGGVAGATP